MKRMQDSPEFPPSVRELAAKANLPVPSWHVGQMRRAMSPPEPPEDDPVEVCEECGAVIHDTPEVDRVCWRCGEAL